ncbi:hypothetical protein CVD23_12090 [Bacillus sp. V33-4]|nr:hypothetical protein CVD23_12090 [Bacillus sp. V33-4]
MVSVLYQKRSKKRNLNVGVITVTPTYGRKLKSNAHIHALVTEGALGSQNEWVRRELIP